VQFEKQVTPTESDINKYIVSYMFQIVNGVNLLTDIPAKPKKPSLYATQILSHQFTDEEMAWMCGTEKSERRKDTAKPRKD
jgi:hypothetical protein